MSQLSTPVRLSALTLGVATMLSLAACTAGGPAPAATPTPAAPAGVDGDGIMPGYQDETTLEFTPLIITSLTTAAVPVEGSDGRAYLAYELSVLNDAPRDATVTKVETLVGDEGGAVIETRDQAQVAANMLIAGNASMPTGGSAVIPAGRTAFIVLRDAYDNAEDIPTAVTHRISAKFAPATTDDGALAPVYPDHVAQLGGPVATSPETPIVIGPPLAGANWVATNGLETEQLNYHSNVVIPVGGRVNAAEQFGIDFLRVDPETVRSYRGDPAQNASYLAFDQPLLAVANATVVKVVSDLPDITPKVLPQLERLDLATGNSVVLDLGDGNYALYAHMKQGSATVMVGDKVKKGQEIGRLGNSGNTSEAHLHFQLQRGPLLSADNVPWVIDSFTATAVIAPDGESLDEAPAPGPRTDEMPVGNSVSEFSTRN